MPEERAIQHTIAGADSTQSLVLPGVVVTLGEFFEREDSCARNQENNSKVQADKGHECRRANVIIDNVLFGLDVIVIDLAHIGAIFAIETVSASCDFSGGKIWVDAIFKLANQKLLLVNVAAKFEIVRNDDDTHVDAGHF